MSEPFENELQRNSVLRCIYENAKVNAILVSDMDGYILHLNEAFTHFYGHTVDGLRHKHARILFTEEDQKYGLPEREIEGVKQQGVFRDRNYVIHRDGHCIFTDGESVLVKTDGGSSFIFKIIQNIHEQKVSEMSLRHAQAFSENVISSIGEGLLVLDTEQRILKVNRQFYNMLDSGETEVQGRYLSQLETPLFSSERFKLQLNTTITEQRALTLEFEYRAKNGITKVLCVTTCILDGDVAEKNSLIVLSEITAAKKREESEKNFRRLVMQAPVGICIISHEDLVAEVFNDAFLALVGKSKKQLEGQPFWQGIPEAKNFYAPILAGVFKTGIPYRGVEHKVMLNRNGKEEEVYVNFVYEPLANESGQINQVMVLAIEVTEQARTRQAIGNAEQRARLAIEAAELGVYEVNLQTQDLTTDARFQAIFGFDHQVSREIFAAAIHPDDRTIRDTAHRNAVQSGHLQYEVRVIHPDQSVRWVRIRGTVTFDNDQVPVRLLGIAQDVTDVKSFSEALAKQVRDKTRELSSTNVELEATVTALKKSNAQLEEFAHAASHDLKEPIRKIFNFSERVKSTLAPRMTAEESQLFGRLEHAADRMRLLVDDLLEYSHVSFAPREKEIVDLNKKVALVLDDLEVSIQQKKAIISVETLPVVKGYRRQLQQLFQNLISNALKYSKAGVAPHIQIRSQSIMGAELASRIPETDKDKSFYLIQVRDNGIGFDQEYAERIFKMFHRLHGKMEYSGTGIGLSIVRKVVETHQGYIWAESEVNKGATFYVLLPNE